MTNAANIDESLRGDVPEWAERKAVELCHAGNSRMLSLNHWRGHTAFNCLARYIAAHEETPVDPLLVEARNLLASNSHDPDEAEDILLGNWDETYPLPLIELALRRGIELAGDRT